MDKFITTAGIVGKSPTIKPTSKGEVLEFSIAVKDGFGDAAVTTWFDISVWNEGLQASVKREVYKGAKVAVMGKLLVREDDGRTFLKIQASMVGLVEWLLREQAPAPRVIAKAAPANESEAIPDDDLDF